MSKVFESAAAELSSFCMGAVACIICIGRHGKLDGLVLLRPVMRKNLVTMEPMNCNAHFTGDACEVWGPLQGPELTRLVIAGALQIPPQKVTVNRTLLGGGFGRRLLADLPLEAALISKAVGRPVKVIWSREEDMTQDVYRPQRVRVYEIQIGQG